MHGTDTRTVGNYAGIRVPEHEKHGTVSPLLSRPWMDGVSILSLVRVVHSVWMM